MSPQQGKPTLQQEEQRFARDVGQATGFDPRVVYAWVVQEGAYAPGGTGGLNFLNLKPEHGDPYTSVSPGGFERFSSMADAERAAVHRIREIVLREPNATYSVPGHGGPGEYTLAEHTTPASQIGLIAASPWDESHYGGSGGPLLQSTFNRLFGIGTGNQPARQVVTPAEATPSHPSGSTTTQAPLSASDWTSFDLKDLANTPGALFAWLRGILGSVGLRLLEIVGGLVLLLIGLLMVGRAATPAQAARTVRGAV